VLPGSFDATSSHDGPPELLCPLWPLPSGLGLSARSRIHGLPRALTHRLLGVPPRSVPHFPRQAVLAHAPLSLDTPRSGGRNPLRDRTCVQSSISAGTVPRFPRALRGSAGGPPHITVRPPVGWTDISQVPARNACCCRTSSARPFAGCLDRHRRRASTAGFAKVSLRGQIGATRLARSARVVRSPLRRLATRAGSQAVAPGTGPDSAEFPPRFPADRPWLPSDARFGLCDAFRQRCLTPLEEPASRSLARSGCEPRTRRTASPQPLPPCRFYDFEAFLGSSGQRIAVRRFRRSGCTLSFHGLCSPSRSSDSPAFPASSSTLQPMLAWERSRRSRGVCPVEALPPVTG